jgi:TatD DNase family protein
MLIDTHIHLYDKKYDSDRKEVIQRALNNGVKYFLNPAIDSSYTEAQLNLYRQYPDVIRIMSGVHPVSIKDNYREELDKAGKILETHSCVAIGEIGIDLYWDTTYIRQQKEAFREQLRWAKTLGLPVSIHSREAFDEIFTILESEQDGRIHGVMHCFTGTFEQAHKSISLGLHLGIGGVVTFKNGKIDRFLADIDPTYLVLETDGPYLAPAPHRGKRNEPGYLSIISRKLAEIYSLNPDEIARITTDNAKRIFL